MPRGNIRKTFIQTLNRLTIKHQKLLLRKASRKEVLITAEIIVNILSGHFPLTAKEKRSLSKYKKALRKIGVKRRISWTKRRQDIQQHIKAVSLALHIANKYL